MPESNWRDRLTLGIAIAAYLVWAWPAIASLLALIPPLEYEPAQYATEAEREQGRQDQDTYAQIWMAWAAWAQVGVGFFGLIGLGVTIIFARKAWLESKEAAAQAKRTADIAERELTVAKRPRLIIRWRPNFRFQYGWPMLDVVLHNAGPSRAVISVGRCEYRVLRHGTDDFRRPFPAINMRRRWFLEPKEAAIGAGDDYKLTVGWRWAFSDATIQDVKDDKAALLVLAALPFQDHLGNWRRLSFEALVTSDIDGYSAFIDASRDEPADEN